MRFRRKPTEIEAEQYTEVADALTMRGICVNPYCDGRMTVGDDPLKPHVHTAHKGQIVVLQLGDWITSEAEGEYYYPIKDADMRRLYEPLSPYSPRLCPDCSTDTLQPSKVPGYAYCTRCGKGSIPVTAEIAYQHDAQLNRSG